MQQRVVVVGASGAVGRPLNSLLKAEGHQVVPVSRSAGVGLDDRAGLKAAFKCTDAAFVLVPFDQAAHNLHEREVEMAMNLVEALTYNSVARVVLLSGTSAHLGHRAGSGTGAAIMEGLLDNIVMGQRVYLRASFFMENHIRLGFVDQVLATGTYSTMFDATIPTPMIAAADVAAVAADILTQDPLNQPTTRELLGPRAYSMAEATRIMGAAIGRPNLPYVQLDYEQGRNAIVANGASQSFASAVVETARTFNSGLQWEQEPRKPDNTTPTTLEQFAETAIRPDFLGSRSTIHDSPTNAQRNPHGPP